MITHDFYQDHEGVSIAVIQELWKMIRSMQEDAEDV